MSKRTELLGRLGKIGSEALISAAKLKHELEAQGVDKLEHLAKRLNLVRREEFEAVQAMARAARENQEKILTRLTAIESKLGIKVEAKKTKTSKAAAKKKI